jgi:hypothetical protein
LKLGILLAGSTSCIKWCAGLGITGFMGFTKIKGFRAFDHFGTERKNRQVEISDYGFQFHKYIFGKPNTA